MGKNRLEEQVGEVLSEFRKHLKADGGDIELAGITNGVVKVRLSRTTVPATFSTFLRDYRTREGITCGSCRIPTSTILGVLEIKIKERVPEIKRVEAVR